jgi:hypothetical protein
VYPLPEKGEAGASIDPLGSFRVYMVAELKEPGNGVMVSASKEERNYLNRITSPTQSPSFPLSELYSTV